MKKRVQFKRIDDVVRGYVKEGITSYGSINLPNSNSGIKMGIRFKLANLYVIFDTIEGFYYFGKRVNGDLNILIYTLKNANMDYKKMKKELIKHLEKNTK